MVVDSNVYISALLLGESARRVIASAESRFVDIYSSEPIMNEVERVLRDKFRWSQERVTTAANYVRSLSRFVDSQCTVSDCPDPDDNRVLEWAIEAKAMFIVTGDHHLLDLDPYRGVAVVTPREFLDRVPWQAEK